MIAGHLTCTYVVYRKLNSRGVGLNLPALFLGSILPDIIDKSLALFLFFPLRGVAHSFLIVVPLVGLSFLVFRNKLRVLNSLQFGVLMHLIEDLEGGYDELFWPFMYDMDFSGEFSISLALYKYYVLHVKPISLSVEVVCVLLCIYYLLYDKFGLNTKKLTQG